MPRKRIPFAHLVAIEEENPGLAFAYAGEKFGWHEDWAEARPSAFPTTGHAYYARKGEFVRYAYDEANTPPARQEPLYATPVPPYGPFWEKTPEPHLNLCGVCYERFTGLTPQASADGLRAHVESSPCRYFTGVQREPGGEPPAPPVIHYPDPDAQIFSSEEVKARLPKLLMHEQFRMPAWHE